MTESTVRFPNGSPSIEELVLRVARGDGSGEESARVMRWRWESPGNDERYVEISRLVRVALRIARLESTPVPAWRIVEIARERGPADPPPVQEGP